MTKAADKPLSLRAYAAHRGVSHQAVSQAIAAKRLVKSVVVVNGSPKITSAAAADAEWAANTDQSAPRNSVSGEPKRSRATAAAPYQPRPAGAAPAGGAGEGEDNTNRGPSYATSRAIREAYQARLAKLEYDERSGKLVDAAQVKVAAYNVARRARDMLLTIPDRVSVVLAGTTDDHEVHRILTAELRRVCEEIAKA